MPQSKAGKYAVKGAIIGAAIAGAFALLTLNPFVVLSAGIVWGTIGAGIGGLIGALEERKGSTGFRETTVSVTHGTTPAISQEQGQQYGQSTSFRDRVDQSRTYEKQR